MGGVNFEGAIPCLNHPGLKRFDLSFFVVQISRQVFRCCYRSFGEDTDDSRLKSLKLFHGCSSNFDSADPRSVQSFSGLVDVWVLHGGVWLTGAPEELKEPKLFVTRLPEGQRCPVEFGTPLKHGQLALPKTNIAPQNGCLGDYFHFGKG